MIDGHPPPQHREGHPPPQHREGHPPPQHREATVCCHSHSFQSVACLL